MKDVEALPTKIHLAVHRQGEVSLNDKVAEKQKKVGLNTQPLDKQTG